MSTDGVLKGLAGIAYTKEQYSQISVPLTDEYITETIREVQELFENPDNIGFDGTDQFLIGDAYWNDIAPREELLKTIASTYAAPGVTAWYSSLPEVDVTNGANFYQAREAKIATLLNDSSRGLSDEQKRYWQNRNSRVETPFQYGYYEGWLTIHTCFELLMFAILAVCIVLAPVFSGEYQAGTDAVILSGKYGKTKLTTAKIIASYLFGLLAFTIHILVAFGLPLAALFLLPYYAIQPQLGSYKIAGHLQRIAGARHFSFSEQIAVRPSAGHRFSSRSASSTSE